MMIVTANKIMIAKGRVERLRFSDSEEEGETAVEERRVVGGGGAVVRSIMRVQEEEDYGYAEVTKGEIGAEWKGEFIGKNEGGVQMPAMRLAKTFDFDDSEEEEERKQTHS